MRRAGWASSGRHRSGAGRWLALLAAGVLGAGDAAAATLKLDSAAVVLDESASPPPDAAPWQTQTLPDNWNLSRPGAGGLAWYRVRFELPHAPDRLYAIYVRKLSMNAAFHANGAFLGSGGQFEEPVARHWNRPQFFTIPPQLLRAGPNVLHVRLRAYPNSRGGLGEIEVGPEAELRPHYERRRFVQTVLPQLCNIVVAALGAFAFALWVKRRAEPTYVWFCVFSLLWAFRSTHMFVRDIPVDAFLWDVWVQSSFGWCALLFIVLAMRFSGRRWPRFEAGLLAYGALGPLVMYAGGPERLHAIASNWSFAIVPLAIFFEGFLIREAWRQRTAISALLAAVWALIIAASVHDGLVHRDRLAFDSFYLVSYVMILLSFVMGWILTNRFVQALNAAEKLNVELEDRVARKHAELEGHFRRLQEMERASAIAAERQRMMSEMHDCIGAQLIATLDLAEHAATPKVEIARGLREVLDGLRLTIDSLEPSEDDLATVLGNLRYRLEGRLRRQGIALDWQVGDLPRLPSLTPHNVLHILRIMQEAFTNIVKHARATSVTVGTACTAGHVVIRVADDGCGFAVGNREGRGLASMRRRARTLGADLSFAPSPHGTTLSLALPRPA
jgi:signal transduction histidine kinase